MERVLEKIDEYPQHTFLFLTKDMNIYTDYDFPENCWLGVTITNQRQMNGFADLISHTTFDEKYKIFISIEPIQEKINLYVNPDWLIIGAETGNRKNKIVPEWEWIRSLIEDCRGEGIPIFLKENLKLVWHKDYLFQEFPQ